jgi:hypothetical protein
MRRRRRTLASVVLREARPASLLGVINAVTMIAPNGPSTNGARMDGSVAVANNSAAIVMQASALTTFQCLTSHRHTASLRRPDRGTKPTITLTSSTRLNTTASCASFGCRRRHVRRRRPA